MDLHETFIRLKEREQEELIAQASLRPARCIACYFEDCRCFKNYVVAEQLPEVCE